MYSERRFSLEEKGNNTDHDLMSCNTLSATKLLGIQNRKDEDKCRDTEILRERSSSTKLQNHILSTYGSYSSKALNIAEWSKQIQRLEDSGSLYPRPIKREMVLITRLISSVSNFAFNVIYFQFG